MFEFKRPVWSPVLSKVAAGLAIGLAAGGMIYAAAATSASVIADSFTSSETERHSRAVEFTDAATRASSEREALLAKCEQMRGTKRRICVAAMNAQEKRASGAAAR